MESNSQQLELKKEELTASLGEQPLRTSGAVPAPVSATDPHSITYYGVKSEKALAQITDKTASRRLGQATEEAAHILGEMTRLIADFHPEEFVKARSLWQKLTGGGGLGSALKQFDAVGDELDALADRLEEQTSQLLGNSLLLERLQKQAETALIDVETHIEHGKPHLDEGTELTSDQQYELASRLLDMATSRVIGLQSIATMQVMRTNIQAIMEKIRGILTHALPLWRQQTRFAIEIAARVEKGEKLDRAVAALASQSELDSAEVKSLAQDLEAQDTRDVFEKIRAGVGSALQDAANAVIQTP